MNQKTKRLILTLVAVVALVAIFAVMFQMLGNRSTKISEYTFRKNIGKYVEINLNIYKVTCKDENGAVYSFVTADRNEFNAFVLNAMENGTANAKLLEGNAYTVTDPNATSWTDYIMPVLWILLLVGMAVMMFRSIARQNNQNMDFGRSRAKMVKDIKVRFSDVAGAEEEKEELQEMRTKIDKIYDLLINNKSRLGG